MPSSISSTSVNASSNVVNLTSNITATRDILNVTQTAHGFSVGNVVRFDGSTFVLARANTLEGSNVSGIVSEVTSTNTFKITKSGGMTGLTGLVTGDLYYLSPTIDGAVTRTRPTTVNQYIKPVFYAVSSTAIVVLDQQPIKISPNEPGFTPEQFPDDISPLGHVTMFAGTPSNIPENWLLCDGSALSKTENSSQYQDLYDVIGNQFPIEATVKSRSNTASGFPIQIQLSDNHDIEVNDTLEFTLSNGTIISNVLVSSVNNGVIGFSGISGGTTAVSMPSVDSVVSLNFASSNDKFFIPDLRSRFPIGVGTGDGLTERTIGTYGGTETHQLTTDELPSHTHTSDYENSNKKVDSGTTFNVPNTSGNNGSVGGDTPHNNMPPFVGIHFIIRSIEVVNTAFVMGSTSGS